MDTSFSKGEKLYRAKKYQEALDAFLETPVEDVKDKYNLAYYIGLCYERLGNHEEALGYLEQVVTNSLDRKKVNQCTLTLALIYSLTGRSRMAEFELGKLAEDGVDSDPFWCTKGYVAWYRNEIPKAMECYEKVLERSPENSTALNALGYILATTTDEYTRALILCKKAVDLDPKSAACLDSLGWVYYNLGLFDEAESYVKKALSILPDNEIIQEHLEKIEGVK